MAMLNNQMVNPRSFTKWFAPWTLLLDSMVDAMWQGNWWSTTCWNGGMAPKIRGIEIQLPSGNQTWRKSPNHSWLWVKISYTTRWLILTGWWYTYPSEKYESQMGLLFPIYGKINYVPNHQPANNRQGHLRFTRSYHMDPYGGTLW